MKRFSINGQKMSFTRPEILPKCLRRRQNEKSLATGARPDQEGLRFWGAFEGILAAEIYFSGSDPLFADGQALRLEQVRLALGQQRDRD